MKERDAWDDVQHHPGKLALTLVVALAMAGLAVWRALDGAWDAAVVFALLAAWGLVGVKAIRDGRNPWYLRSIFDRPPSR